MLEFTPSTPLTLGVELELQIVNRRDYNLTRGASDLMELVHREPAPAGEIKPEITEGMIEISTGIHHDVDAMLAELASIRAVLLRHADRLNLGLCGGGAHPFQQWPDQRIYPQPRYRLVSELYGYLAQQFTVFGQHIHVGCPDGDHAVQWVQRLAPYMPHFIALSASSPFYQGVDSAFQSSRLNCVNAFPLSGFMPAVADWAEFNAYFDKMRSFGVVESMKDFYWDIRPKPEFGTLEIRVCDTPLTLARAVQLAAYARALAAWFQAEPRAPEPDQMCMYAFNRFQACRFGLAGNLILADGASCSIAEHVLATLDTVLPYADHPGMRAALVALGEVARKQDGDAHWLRQQHQARGSLSQVVRLACEQWAAQ